MVYISRATSSITMYCTCFHSRILSFLTRSFFLSGYLLDSSFRQFFRSDCCSPFRRNSAGCPEDSMIPQLVFFLFATLVDDEFAAFGSILVPWLLQMSRLFRWSRCTRWARYFPAVSVDFSKRPFMLSEFWKWYRTQFYFTSLDQKSKPYDSILNQRLVAFRTSTGSFACM